MGVRGRPSGGLVTCLEGQRQPDSSGTLLTIGNIMTNTWDHPALNPTLGDRCMRCIEWRQVAGRGVKTCSASQLLPPPLLLLLIPRRLACFLSCGCQLCLIQQLVNCRPISWPNLLIDLTLPLPALWLCQPQAWMSGATRNLIWGRSNICFNEF